MSPRVVLIGMPGSGKTTVGELLAERWGVQFFDADLAIEQVTGQAITDIFDERGEEGFREVERDVTLELLRDGGSADGAVVSLGGGAVLTDDIREALAGLATVWLQVGVVQATRRIGMNRLRPLLLGDVRARLQGLLDERIGLYEQAARWAVDTTGLDPDHVADRVEEVLA